MARREVDRGNAGDTHAGDRAVPGAPCLPDYGGACIDGVAGALIDRDGPAPSWLPEPAQRAQQAVLLVLDGLGWDQLRARPQLAPFLTSMVGSAITSVVPTTTATALTSITTGLAPAAHGMVGYRVLTDDGVLNILRWRTHSGDARTTVPPEEFQAIPPFAGRAVPVVSRAEFADSGFTVAHLRGTQLIGWRTPSTLVARVAELLDAGEPFVYAYYDGIDKVAHEFGFGRFYDLELRFADQLAERVAEVLPDGAALVVTADHGQVHVGDANVEIPSEILGDVELMSGEGRFRWLHVRPGTAARVAASARDALGDVAWVRTVEELDADGWYGGRLSPAGRARLGEVALVARAAVAFPDPSDRGEARMQCRHGSLTHDEMLVPLLAVSRGSG